MTPTSRVKRGYSNVSCGQAHWRYAGVEGPANPLICLHMVPKSSRSFAALLPHIARDRISLAPDLPGHGASDPLRDPASVQGYAQWLWELLDAHFPGQAVDLLGYHTGAMVAVAAAQARPTAVGKLVALSAPAFSDEEIAEFREFFAPIPLDEEGTRFRIMWERIQRFGGPGTTLKMAAASLSDNLLAGEDYEEGHRAAFDHAKTFLGQLSTLEHRVLVINIADELEKHTRRIDPFLRNGWRKDYPQWGNGFLELEPEAVAREVLAFLDDQS
jgi:pimeloyl-ACP methyl ester carboxylesterase